MSTEQNCKLPPVTGWFPGDVKPARVGVYERQMPLTEQWYSLWDGKRWRVGCSDSAKRAAAMRTVSLHQNLPWRGLSAEPMTERFRFQFDAERRSLACEISLTERGNRAAIVMSPRTQRQAPALA